MLSYVGFKHDETRIDPCECEREIEFAIRREITESMEKIHAGLVPWVAVANRVLELRCSKQKYNQPHWHWYPDGRLVIWITLMEDESFASLYEIYEIISEHVKQIAPGYKATEVVAEPEPDDSWLQEHGIKNRIYEWKIGWRRLQLSVSYNRTKECRIVEEKETIERTKRTVICGAVEAGTG